MQLETRVMPGAAQCFANKESLVEWRAIVRALGTDGEPVYLRVNEEDCLAEGVTGD